nr:AraC family ligand binding domain-containing protein [Terribacillus saccharophilus]
MIRLYENKHQEKDEVARHQHDTHQLLYVLDGEGECELGIRIQKADLTVSCSSPRIQIMQSKLILR